MTDGVVAAAPPGVAVSIFGAELSRAERFVSMLAEVGVPRGVIGPREVPRLWDRHLLNCAVLAELIPQRAQVVDVGSGAGLPGVALALVRPDLRVTLMDSMRRRTEWLDYVVAELPVRATVLRGRAEDQAVRGTVSAAEVVTARAVAPLDKLAAWCLPLLAEGGEVLALKGDSAEQEVRTHRAAIQRSGGGPPTVAECGRGTLDVPTRVVRIRRVGQQRGAGRGNRARRSR